MVPWLPFANHEKGITLPRLTSFQRRLHKMIFALLIPPGHLPAKSFLCALHLGIRICHGRDQSWDLRETSPQRDLMNVLVFKVEKSVERLPIFNAIEQQGLIPPQAVPSVRLKWRPTGMP